MGTPPAPSPFAGLPRDELERCIRCGFCLPVCPTYKLTGREVASPRGRLALMRAAADGELDPEPRLAAELFFCLECRACETACPAGVPFAHIMEPARAALADRGLSPAASPLALFALRGLIPSRRLLRLAGRLSYALRQLAPRRLAGQAAALPKPDSTPLPAFWPARGERRCRVALFTGCVQDVFFRQTHRAAARLLSRYGAEVVVPPGQTCCGALHAHAGDASFAQHLADRNLAAFKACGADYLVTSAGGCGAQLKQYLPQARDASELLVELAPAVIGRLPGVRATLQDSCHLLHGQGISQPPRDLLRRVEGLELVEFEGHDSCCGSAGIYSLTHPEASERLIDAQVQALLATGADLVVVANPGCELQWRWGLQRAGLSGRLRATHLLELLDEAAQRGG